MRRDRTTPKKSDVPAVESAAPARTADPDFEDLEQPRLIRFKRADGTEAVLTAKRRRLRPWLMRRKPSDA